MLRPEKFGASRAVVLLSLILAGCSHTIPSDSPPPQPPPLLGKTPPVIEPLNAAMKQAQAPESLLPVTLTADLTPVQRVIQAAVPERITDEHHPLGRDYRWRFIREGEPEVAIQDGLVTYRAVYRGDIESTAARACRLDPVNPVLEGTGRLQLREQDQALLVTMSRPQTSITLKPDSDSKCNMFNIPVKDQLAELFTLEAVNQHMARSVEEAGYAIPIQLVWDRLQEPLSVGGANQPLCLYGKARDFVVGSLKGPAQQTTITGLARQTPVAVYQTPCQKPKSAAPLKVHLDPQAAAAQAGAYTILLTVPVPYAVLNQQLQDRLFHQTVKLPGTFGGNVVIERATASDANGRTLIAVDTSGEVNGTLYYWGTPKLEREGAVIAISDLQMANETKLALDEVKTGYWQTVDQELRDRLKQAVQMDLSQRVAAMKSALSGQHKSGGLAMDVLLARQQAGQVISTKDALVADVLLEGTASAAAQLTVKSQTPRHTAGRASESGPAQSARMPEERLDPSAPERR
jgi:hypothetical protein